MGADEESVNRTGKGAAPDAAKVFALYAQRLTRVAEQHLSRKLAARLDGEDVVQSLFRTFFRRSAEGQFQIDGADHLWRLLVRISILKARAHARHHNAARRAATAEVEGDGDSWLTEALEDEPGPAEAAALIDQIDALLRGLPADFTRVLEMKLQGYTVAEIATALQLSRQTVYRALQLLQHRLERESG